MTRLVVSILVLVGLSSLASGICDLPPPVREFDGDPGGPSTPGGPTTPPDEEGPTTPDPRAGIRPGTRTRTGSGVDYHSTWHLWWELNREYLLGLRKTLRSKDVVSGGVVDRERRAALRAEARAALRAVAAGTERGSLREAALVALGRAGDDTDAQRFVKLLRTPGQPREVYEGAVVGLALLDPIKDEAARAAVRALFQEVLGGAGVLRGRTRLLAIMALSLRGRDDRALGWALAARCQRDIKAGNEAAAVLYGCALTKDRSLIPILLDATRRGRLGKRSLHDVARSHAALGLALTGDPVAVRTLTQILTSRRTRIHTRRAAALGVGLLLRRELAEDARTAAERAMTRAFEKDHDVLVRSYAAVGAGTAHRPFLVERLCRTVERRGHAVEAPYAALALGLAGPRLEGVRGKEVRALLCRQLGRAKNLHLTAALSIAVGLSGADEARDTLLRRLEDKHLKASVRGPAIQALGLLRRVDTNTEKTLVKALDDGADEVVEDAAIALGLLGTRTTARMLVGKLATTRSEPVQVHMVAALSHLGGTAAVEPLIELLNDKSKKHTMRASAAAALGILVMTRDADPMFEIDAHTNPFALTRASRHLVLLY